MRYIILISGIIASLSCSCSRTTAPSSSPTLQPRGAVISRLVGRDESIVIRSGPTGPTYSVESNNNIPITAEMTLDQMSAQNPQLFRNIKTMEASTVWAGCEDDCR